MQGAAHRICSRIGHGQGGYTRNNWKGVEGQESYIRNTQIPFNYYHLLSLSLSLSSLLLLFVADNRRVSPLHFHLATQAIFEFLRVRHSVAERYRSVVVSIRFGEKWTFFQSSGNIVFGYCDITFHI